MLETNVLLLRPAVAGQPRVIADAATGKVVGVARVQPGSERGLFAALLGPVLAVHELEEEPLVFTVRRCFLWPQREVRDAEGERIGYVSPRAVRDRNRLLYAGMRREAGGVAYQCVNGAMLATTRHTRGGVELSITDVIRADPFAKMLLLAAALLEE
jgi:hypothetical protein